MSLTPGDQALRDLAAIVDSSDDAIVGRDLSGTITAWNRAAERMFGYAPTEILGQSIRLLIPANRQHEEDAFVASIRAGQAVRSFETVQQRKDGTLVPVLLTVSPVCDDRGTVIGASNIARAISQVAPGGPAARLLAAVVESSDDAIVTKSLDSTITSWNRGAERIFGYTAAEAIGRSIRMIIPPDLQNEEDIVLARIRAGDRFDHYETRRRRKDGADISISLTVSPLHDDRGVIVGASKIARDISEQVRLRAVAAEQAGITEKLSEVGALVAASLDRTAVIQRVADLATALTDAEIGAFFHNVADRHSGDVHKLFTLSGAHKDAFENLPGPAPPFGPTFRAEGVIRVADVTADPRYRHNLPFQGIPPGNLPVRSYLAVPVKAASGDVLGGLFFAHARAGVFTEQHERLATGITAWASIALENSRLYVEAREADRLKDEFLAVLSHELRTPLNAILGYARLLRGRILDNEKADRAIETLERNAMSLTRIVEDVLDVSRIVSGRIRLDVQTVELPLVVHNAVATVQPAADAKGIRLQTIVDPRVDPIAGDPDRLQQVVWNLVANAVKFTPKHGRIQVRLERVNSHVEIAISDTGVGIHPDFLPHVFERFRQADASSSRRHGGLGVGLALVHDLIVLHGGSVQAQSAGEGQGATFTIDLPSVAAHEVDATIEGEGLQALAKASLDRVRVLLIDDDGDARDMSLAVLEQCGARVKAVSSSAEAIASLLDTPRHLLPHVIVSDLGMPGKDGYQLIRQIRAIDNELGRIPAVAVTGYATADDVQRALAAGFQVHISKPMDPAAFVAAVADLARVDRA
jgi:PAS domain S-box-containing protein